MISNLGQIVADAWEMVCTLEGDPFRAYRPGIKTGTWRGDRYAKLWNFRTGASRWVKL